LTVVLIVPWAALLSAHLLHPEKPRVVLRTGIALVATVVSVIVYVETRRRFFPSPIDETLLQPAAPDWHWSKRSFHDLLRWFAQPRLPHDPINNPLVGVPWPERVATALRIYVSGLGQVVWPVVLSGDYSYAAQLPEKEPLSGLTALRAGLFCAPMLLAIVMATVARLRSTGSGSAGLPMFRTGAGIALLVALGLMIVPVGYFPQSNILVVLPTIRADRFWYVPVIGAAWVLAGSWTTLWHRWREGRMWLIGVLTVFLGFQAVRARLHALDYNSDLHFWRATSRAMPNSAKAHLNYGVMLGARGDLAQRLIESERARRLAPQWPMAHVYLGDTLCRMQRSAEAWPHYRRGFELGPNESNLIALGLQCLWDQQQFLPHQAELEELTARFPSSWLDYLVTDTIANGVQHGGVDKKYRPRGYDEGVADP
jgi:hypothetical protein